MAESIELKEMLPWITEQVTAELRNRAVDAFKYNATEAVSKEVNRYIQEVIVPEVSKELQSKRAELIAVFVASVNDVANMTADAIKTQALKNLTSYGSENLIGAFMKNIIKGEKY